MELRTRLQGKMGLDRMARQVAASLDAGRETGRFDMETMRRLLAQTDFEESGARGLVWFSRTDAIHGAEHLVLDNGLGVYRTSVSDLLLRKAPTVREMISFRNVRKILDDSDVCRFKGKQSIEHVRKVAIGRLSIVVTPQDVAALAEWGGISLELGEPEDVVMALSLFDELQGRRPVGRPLVAEGVWVTAKRRGRPFGTWYSFRRSLFPSGF